VKRHVGAARVNQRRHQRGIVLSQRLRLRPLWRISLSSSAFLFHGVCVAHSAVAEAFSQPAASARNGVRALTSAPWRWMVRVGVRGDGGA